MIMPALLIAVASIGVSGVPGLVLGRRSPVGQWIATLLNVAGSAIGCAALAAQYAGAGLPQTFAIPWGLPIGRFAAGIDDLSLLFLFPIFFISALGAVYGLGYWKQAAHPGNGRKLRLCWGLMTAGMASLVLARDGVLFLIAWEVMALSAYFLVGTEENKPQARDAAWVYLIATHVGTLCLFAFLALLRQANGSFDLWPSDLSAIPPGRAAGLFVLGALGFGLKAGIIPLHVWLPGAHANAASHVSALMSGVLLKTGVYGLLRVGALIPHPPAWWGATLLSAGTLSALLGIAFAAGQRDLKRLLAYSSIENVGIITMGIGLALLGRSLGHPDWTRLGLAGALLHVLNHSLFKPLLFLGSGSVVHAARTREMDLLGGLGKSMPRTFALFLIGAIAICGLPPLNGFVSELIIYLGLFRSLGTSAGIAGGAAWASLAAPALALVGAMAVVTFVKLLGTVFAGAARSSRTAHAHDPGFFMLAPMVVLAGCCLLIGMFPALLAGALDRATASWAGSAESTHALGRLAQDVPLAWLSVMSAALIALAAGGGAWLWLCGRPKWSSAGVGSALRTVSTTPQITVRSDRESFSSAAGALTGGSVPGATKPPLGAPAALKIPNLSADPEESPAWERTGRFRPARTAPTWDCGYARPSPRMQYSGSSFSQMLVGLLSWALWPRTATPVIKSAFPQSSGFKSDLPDPVLDRGLRPAFGSAGRLLSHARVLQRGPIQIYLLYVVAILLTLLLFS